VHLRGARGTCYSGTVVDLSRSGVLVALDDPAFAVQDRNGMELVLERFPDGVGVIFPELDMERYATIVRVTLQDQDHLGLGCAFSELLGLKDALRLGIVAAESDFPEACLDVLPLVPSGRGAVSVIVLESADGTHLGPFAIGPVVGAGDRVLEAFLPRYVEDLADGCAEGAVRTAVAVGTRRLWEGAARLVAVEDANGQGTRVRFLADEPFGNVFRRHLRPVRR